MTGATMETTLVSKYNVNNVSLQYGSYGQKSSKIVRAGIGSNNTIRKISNIFTIQWLY
jgi:hypothetical protein